MIIIVDHWLPMIILVNHWLPMIILVNHWFPMIKSLNHWFPMITCKPLVITYDNYLSIMFVNIFVSGIVTRVNCIDTRHDGPRCFLLANNKTQRCHSQCAAGCTGTLPSNCNVSMPSGKNSYTILLSFACMLRNYDDN